MAVLSDYTSGTITLANGSTAVTGTGTLFDVAKFREGDTLQIQNLTAVIASVNSNTSLTLTEPWSGTSLADAPYRARYLPDGARVTAQATTLIELLGNGVLSNLAELGVEDGKVPVGNAAGEYELKDHVADPNGSLAKFAFLDLDGIPPSILQTNAAGELVAAWVGANKSVVTDDDGNIVPIDLGTLGRALLALATGNNAQYVQGDGTLQAKAGLPVSTATQNALNGKFDNAGGTITGPIWTQMPGNAPMGLHLRATGATSGAAGAYNISPQLKLKIPRGGFGDGDGAFGAIQYEEHVGSANQLVFRTNGFSSNHYWHMRNDGSFNAEGPINGSAKNFEIDHTVDPDNYDLRHCATESDEMGLTYRGRTRLVNGRATVNVEEYRGVMPGTYVRLWADAWVSSILKTGPKAHVAVSEIDGATFELVCEDETSNDLVSWFVTARRNDPYVRWKGCTFTDDEGHLIVEFEKPE